MTEVKRATFLIWRQKEEERVRVDSPGLAQDQLFSMETDDRRREAHSRDGGQSARAPGTPGLARAPTRRLIPPTASWIRGRKVRRFPPALEESGRYSRIWEERG